MKIERFKPMASPKKRNTKQFLLTGWGDGCSIDTCHCSDGHWLSISDGNVGLLVWFENRKEMLTTLKPKPSKKGHTIRVR